jgi:hypothetical protein
MNEIRCQSCRRTYTAVHGPLVEQAARAAGWVVWDGDTLGGEHVRRVYCTTCAGRSNDGPDQQPRWDARCNTCAWSASQEDDYDDEPFTGEDAHAWRQEHECEPDVDLIPPEQVAREREGVKAFARAHQRVGAA